jgi:selenophosphate synthetase-related protein
VTDLAHLAAAVRDAPGLRAKRELRLLDRLPFAVDGDDAAVIAHGDAQLVLCGEAIAPTLLTADPFAAGAAAVATNVADVRAMGGRPLGLVDTLISPDREHADRVLDGLAWAADRLGVAVVGGHLTLGGAPALSAFCAGSVSAPLRAAAARPGDVLLAAFCLEGEQRDTDPPIFTSLRDRDPAKLRDDGEALVEVAEQGLCHAARDVSMPGVAGSLLQLLELAGCGATLDLDRLPRPDGVALGRWLVTFPSFGFVLAAAPDTAQAACAAFTRRGLACAPCGSFDDSHVLRLAGGGESADVWDLAAEPLTRAGRPRSG